MEVKIHLESVVPMYGDSEWFTYPQGANMPSYAPGCCGQGVDLHDYGPVPFIANLEAAATQNTTFRTALWTGSHLQLTLMSIPVGGDIGQEIHPNLDQFLYIEEGRGLAKMAYSNGQPVFQGAVCRGFAIFVPAGTWHNLINIGDGPLKLFSIYAPPAHPHGTVHRTKEEAGAGY